MLASFDHGYTQVLLDRVLTNDFMSETQFIELALHSEAYAGMVKKLLETHGITAILERRVYGALSCYSVKVESGELKAALKVIEHCGSEVEGFILGNTKGTGSELLVPIDFSPASVDACRIAFQMAKRLSLNPVLLHAYSSPYFGESMAYDYSALDMEPGIELEEAETEHDTSIMATRMMSAFKKKINKDIANGVIPDVKFNCVTEEGVPENVILDRIRDYCPAFVVMATSGSEDRSRHIIGSVTAEVLDRCRIPILTVPSGASFESVESVKKLLFFCSDTRNDMFTAETLMSIYDYPEVEMWLMPVDQKPGAESLKRIEIFVDYLNESYPNSKFIKVPGMTEGFIPSVESVVKSLDIQMFIVPNRKTNVFSRLFRPGMAHKLLFETSIPMLAVPV